MNLPVESDGPRSQDTATPLPWVRVAALIYLPLALAGVAWIAWQGGQDALYERLIGPAPLFHLAIGTAVGLAVVVCGRLITAVSARGRKLELALAELLGPVPAKECVFLARPAR